MTLIQLRTWLTEAGTGFASLLVMATLILAVGFCLFDGHCDDSAALDLCLSMLVPIVAVLLTCRLLPLGTLPAFAPVSLQSAARRVLDPPPRLSA